MDIGFLRICLVIIIEVFFLQKVIAVYNKDVTCIIDPGKEPVCTTSPRIQRKSNNGNLLPSHDPYIPRNGTILLNCSMECNLASFNSMTEIVSSKLNLKACFPIADSYSCESIRYHYLKNIDKTLFLMKTIPDRIFYTVDCLVYAGSERICHKKDEVDSYANLVDTGTLARPNEVNVLAQDEFICEESGDKEVNCDLNPFVPFDHGLKLKEAMHFGDTVLLKTGPFVVILSRKCVGSWCGYSGRISPSRRTYNYRVPGDSVYRCFYAKKQQVCKQLYSRKEKDIYNSRGWISNR